MPLEWNDVPVYRYCRFYGAFDDHSSWRPLETDLGRLWSLWSTVKEWNKDVLLLDWEES